MATIPIVYNQQTQDIAGESRIDSRFIGLLDRNRTRLNVHSALTRKQDDVDTFRFRVARGGTVGFGGSVLINGAPVEDLEEAMKANSTVRFEILDRAQRVIADSKALSGTAKANYEKALQDKLDLKSGDYYIRVTRDRSIPKTQAVEYTFQLRNGIYRQDFDTTETPPVISTAVSTKVLMNSSIAQQLNTYRTSILPEGSIFGDLSKLI